MAAKVKSLPRGRFEIHLSTGDKIEGHFTTWAAKRVCDKLKLSLSELFQINARRFDYIAEFLLCSVEYVSRLKKEDFNYTTIDAYDWIDELNYGKGEDNHLLKFMIDHFSDKQSESTTWDISRIPADCEDADPYLDEPVTWDELIEYYTSAGGSEDDFWNQTFYEVQISLFGKKFIYRGEINKHPEKNLN